MFHVGEVVFELCFRESSTPAGGGLEGVFAWGVFDGLCVVELVDDLLYCWFFEEVDEVGVAGGVVGWEGDVVGVQVEVFAVGLLAWGFFSEWEALAEVGELVDVGESGLLFVFGLGFLTHLL